MDLGAKGQTYFECSPFLSFLSPAGPMPLSGVTREGQTLLVNKLWNKSAYIPASTRHTVSDPFVFLHGASPHLQRMCCSPSELWGWDPRVYSVCASQGTLDTSTPHTSHRLFPHMTNPGSCDLPLAWQGHRNGACSSCRPQTFSYINHRVLLHSVHLEWKTLSWGDIDQTVYRYLHIEGH